MSENAVDAVQICSRLWFTCLQVHLFESYQVSFGVYTEDTGLVGEWVPHEQLTYNKYYIARWF